MINSEILKKKRLGGRLGDDEIFHLIEGLKNGKTDDLQITAFLTSACIIGLSPDETTALTFAMRDSGMKFNFRHLGKPVIDKHSTGGVGDKLSLLLVPIVSACGVAVPMISGRGLGHTGGTVDKLESIPGFDIRPDEKTIYRLMEENGCFMSAQNDFIAPADKKLYHIRDITGNVESTGLITASILSKKLVEDLDGLVIDMKTGSGAFMKSMAEAEELAKSMKTVAELCGVKISVLFTSMDQPLGSKIGNWLEIEESLDALKGNCPPDIREVTLALAAEMICLAGIKPDTESARKLAAETWDSGKALSQFHKMIESQGGSLEEGTKKYASHYEFEYKAPRSGIITSMDTTGIGIAGIILRAGRQNIDDEIDYGAGIIMEKKIGDEVSSGETLARFRASDKELFHRAKKRMDESIFYCQEKVDSPKLILRAMK
jgi:pyrimidine-nucleoside phosphorylase